MGTPIGEAMGGDAAWEQFVKNVDLDDNGKIEYPELFPLILEYFDAYINLINENKDAINNGQSPFGLPCDMETSTSGCASTEQQKLTCGTPVILEGNVEEYTGDLFESCIRTEKCGTVDEAKGHRWDCVYM